VSEYTVRTASHKPLWDVALAATAARGHLRTCREMTVILKGKQPQLMVIPTRQLRIKNATGFYFFNLGFETHSKKRGEGPRAYKA
jgi:hypothetical protein